MNAWEVIGYEIKRKENGDEDITLYLQKNIPERDGVVSSGKMIKREWYRNSSVGYSPILGDRVVVEKEDYGKFQVVTAIYVVS